LGALYYFGFLITQTPYLRDFGILPYNPATYLYYGLLPVVFMIIVILFDAFLLLYFKTAILIEDNLKNKLLPVSNNSFIRKLVNTISFSKVIKILDECSNLLIKYLENIPLEKQCRNLSFATSIIVLINYYATQIKYMPLFINISYLVNLIMIFWIIIIIVRWLKQLQSFNNQESSKIIVSNKNMKKNNINYYICLCCISFLIIYSFELIDYGYQDKNTLSNYYIADIINYNNSSHYTQSNKEIINVVLISDQYIFCYAPINNTITPLILNKDNVSDLIQDTSYSNKIKQNTYEIQLRAIHSLIQSFNLFIKTFYH
jgi:hypothetical protein